MLARTALACALLTGACGSSAPGMPGDAGVDGPGSAARGPVQYPADQTLSPLTPDLVERLRAVHAAGTGSDAAIAKIGDSHTVATGYVQCFQGTSVDLDGRDLAATVAQYTDWNRTSLAATVGWSAFQALAGSPSPIEQELAATGPAFATVMFGTNDIGYMRIDRYGQNLAAIADLLLARGIIPVFSTIPPRDDEAAADLEVPHYNAIARGIAQTRGIPLVDLHRELLPLAGHGLGPDHLHLETYSGGACKLTAAGLAHGNNTRNLWVLTALDRLRRTVVASEPAPDADAPRLTGGGSAEDPFVIAQLPFADRRDTRTFGAATIASYPACGPQDESGNEVFYRLEVTAPAMLHAYIVDDAADIDVHLLRGSPDATACVTRGDTEIAAAVQPGTYYIVADTYQSHAGDFTLVVASD